MKEERKREARRVLERAISILVRIKHLLWQSFETRWEEEGVRDWNKARFRDQRVRIKAKYNLSYDNAGILIKLATIADSSEIMKIGE